MLRWLVSYLLLDYILKVDFRQIRWLVILYITLTDGMLGIASQAGGGWSVVSIVLFFVMALLGFVQRIVTGM